MRWSAVTQMPSPTVGPRPWRLACLRNRVPGTWADGDMHIGALKLIPSLTVGPRP